MIRFLNNIHGIVPLRRLLREYKDVDEVLASLKLNSIVEVQVNKIDVENRRLELRMSDSALVEGLPVQFSRIQVDLKSKLTK